MLDLTPIIARIEALLDARTEPSTIYAALEARLALEKVCYDRLRQRHDYIAHDELRKWQPSAVMNTLIRDVDEDLGQTMTLRVALNEYTPGAAPPDDDYVEIGTEIGFEPKRIAKYWNALSKLALHVRLPEHREDHVPAYGEEATIRAKVEEVLIELRRLAKGTMTFSGIGEEVSFDCRCATKNRRRTGLLRSGQVIHCINYGCKASFRVIQNGDKFVFEEQTIDVTCEKCAAINLIPWRFFREMKYDERGSFSCHTCQHRNFVAWQLVQVRPATSDGTAESAS